MIGSRIYSGLRSTSANVARSLLLAAYVAFAIFPLFWLFKISVTPNDLLYSEGVRLFPSQFTSQHYASIVEKSDFPGFFRNSIIVSILTAVFTTLVASGAGYAVSRFRFRGKAWLLGLLLVTQMFPLIMIIAPIFRVFSPLGLTNSLTGLILIYTAYNVPFATFLMQSFFEGIPKELEEAARMDGASRLVAVRRIVLPLTLPGMAATVGFVFTSAWGELLLALMLNSTAQSSTFPVGLLSFVSKFSVDFGQMMAAGMLALVPTCIFFFLIQRHLVRGLTAGAVKG